MSLVRCENGHFYDPERFNVCPNCNQSDISTVGHTENGSSLYTSVINDLNAVNEPDLKDKINDVKDDDNQATIGVWGSIKTEPVVGWLVAIEGSHLGEDFKLKAGRNFIGRSFNMDVALTMDGSVSRDKHAIILYEPRSNVFIAMPGDARELFYLNDKVVLSATEIKAYDVISLGSSKLMFIPCCSDKFKWENVKAED